jgi:hypothetical protein
MTRILLVTDNPSDAIAFYRSMLPWNDIQKEFDDISVTKAHPKDYFGWDILTSQDVIFLSNPRTSTHLGIIKAAKNYGIKVWSDYDDCYLDIPKDNASFNILTAGHVTQMTKECLIESDITTVTTNHLKSVFLPYTERIEVIPNAFPLEFLSESSLGSMVQGSHNFVTWRGSNSHRKNLREYSKEIIEVGKNNPEWLFQFFGFHPEFFDGELNYNHYGFEHLFDSFYRLKRFSSKIHIVTLYERDFNLSKSNISWIEATIAGSVVLAPDWEEWKLPGIVNYTSKEEFKEKLHGLLNGEYDLTKHFEESRDYILNNLSLKKINKDRLKILQQLAVAKSDYSS